jgi:hypothetical protein
MMGAPRTSARGLSLSVCNFFLAAAALMRHQVEKSFETAFHETMAGTSVTLCS